MRIAKIGFAIAAGTMMLAGCAGQRVSPMDMARNQPLVIPPDYALTPPPPAAPAQTPRK